MQIQHKTHDNATYFTSQPVDIKGLSGFIIKPLEGRIVGYDGKTLEDGSYVLYCDIRTGTPFKGNNAAHPFIFPKEQRPKCVSQGPDGLEVYFQPFKEVKRLKSEAAKAAKGKSKAA